MNEQYAVSVLSNERTKLEKQIKNQARKLSCTMDEGLFSSMMALIKETRDDYCSCLNAEQMLTDRTDE